MSEELEIARREAQVCFWCTRSARWVRATGMGDQQGACAEHVDDDPAWRPTAVPDSIEVDFVIRVGSGLRDGLRVWVAESARPAAPGTHATGRAGQPGEESARSSCKCFRRGGHRSQHHASCTIADRRLRTELCRIRDRTRDGGRGAHMAPRLVHCHRATRRESDPRTRRSSVARPSHGRSHAWRRRECIAHAPPQTLCRRWRVTVA